MGEYLPGTLQERLVELRKTHGYKSQQQLVDALEGFVDKATYSRIESGTTRTINHELLLKLADLYGVPTDYILGLCDTPERTYFDIQELGLSVEAAKNLYLGKVDARVVNEMLINRKFAEASREMAILFSNSIVKMLKAHNDLLDFSFCLVEECVQSGAVPDDGPVRSLKKGIKEANIPVGKVEVERIIVMLRSMIYEIKRKAENEVKDVSSKTEELRYEIMETVKREVMDCPNIKDLPEEEKKEIVINAVVKGISLDESIPEEKRKELEVGARQFMPVLLDLWKEAS